MEGGGLLSLKWNNHRSTFFHVLSTVRKKKDSYADATLACEGKFYPVHKLVLSSCSEYFEEMFEHAGQAQCKHPFIVLKDIKCDELECLLSYMYVGEVNVVQENLAGLIKAAECLRIKGLAVPDEEPNKFNREKRSSDNTVHSEPKRRKQEENNSTYRVFNNRNDERRKNSPELSPSSIIRNTNHDEIRSENNITSLESRLQQHDVKTENLAQQIDHPEVLINDVPTNPVKPEPNEPDSMYLSDSNSMTENKDQLLMEGYGDASTDNQQHFMDELLGNSSDATRQMGPLGEYGDGRGESSGSAGGSQQQPMMVIPFGEEFESLYTLELARKNAAALLTTDIPFAALNVPPKCKLYICPVCGKQITNKFDFKRHYMVHSGEKPYPCPHCSYSANQRSHLKGHIATKHGPPLPKPHQALQPPSPEPQPPQPHSPKS